MKRDIRQGRELGARFPWSLQCNRARVQHLSNRTLCLTLPAGWANADIFSADASSRSRVIITPLFQSPSFCSAASITSHHTSALHPSANTVPAAPDPVARMRLHLFAENFNSAHISFAGVVTLDIYFSEVFNGFGLVAPE
jgi:hypothetical protein